jgi:colanic acid/amylovoran biosynthesis glycosyltransferase
MVALQRTDVLVGRTTNWLYDHLRSVTRYSCPVLANELANRDEFPELPARSRHQRRLSRRLWHRVAGNRLYPSDLVWVKRGRPAVLHSHFGYIGVEDLSLARSMDIPWFVSFYGADVYQLPRLKEWREQYDQVFRSATRVLALGPAMAEELVRLGCPPQKVAVHPLGIDVQHLSQKPRTLKPGEPLQLLFAGSFREKKGVRYILEGMALAKQRGVQLTLHLVGGSWNKPGDQETKKDITHRIQTLNLSEQIVQYPLLKYTELIDLAMHCHVFVAPSVTCADGDAEGTPFVLQQMMGTSMPCIATTHSDIPFLFGPYKNLLVPERDAQAIANRLLEYAESPRLLTEHSELLGNQIRTAFDVKVRAESLSDFYDRAAKGESPAAVETFVGA